MLPRQASFWSATWLAASALAWRGKTQTSWDCCKPACAWPSNLQTAVAQGSIKVCDKNDNQLNNGANTQSSCAANNAGNAFLCSDYQPRPVSDQLSYGFAVMADVRDCCECFELQWTSGAAVGKRMQVQMINSGGQTGDITLIVPGGGVGPNPKGCETQYGYDWGRQYGGVDDRDDCQTLPDRLQAGCYWRWNWARGDINGWQVEVKNITCPSQLTSISGCHDGDAGPTG